MTAPGTVLVMGAGSVGCFVGGCLRSVGVDVRFVGRQRILSDMRVNGLRLTDRDGGDRRISPEALDLQDQVPAGIAPALVLLCVKSSATAQAARELAAVLPAGTPVLSLQNGMGNVAAASAAAPDLTVLPGMVPYNVAQLGGGHFHRGTAGRLAAQDAAGATVLAAWLPWFERAGVPMTLHADLRAIQWGKLLINLNNPVNALSGLPLRAQLLNATERRRFAGLIEEALGILQAAGIEPAAMTPLSWQAMIRVLRLPTPLFRVFAARMLRIDAKARSSMADDLALGRPTEIDALCGEIVRQAARTGRSAPLSQAMIDQVRARSAQPTSNC